MTDQPKKFTSQIITLTSKFQPSLHYRLKQEATSGSKRASKGEKLASHADSQQKDRFNRLSSQTTSTHYDRADLPMAVAQQNIGLCIARSTTCDYGRGRVSSLQQQAYQHSSDFEEHHITLDQSGASSSVFSSRKSVGMMIDSAESSQQSEEVCGRSVEIPWIQTRVQGSWRFDHLKRFLPTCT